MHLFNGTDTVTVPIRIKKGRGLRKSVTLGTTTTPLQLALARGHRWLAMLESGEVKSMKGIAIREGINDSYVSRMVNLTTLAPDIVAAKTTYCYLQPRDKQWIALPDQSAVKND